MVNIDESNLDGLKPFTKYPQGSLIVLDYDGSNSVFVPDPSKAIWYPGLKDRVEKLDEIGYIITMSSGRGLDDIQSKTNIPEIRNYAGSHGGQVLVNGELRDYMPKEKQDKLRYVYNYILRKLKERGLPCFIDIEDDKPGSMILHWRKYCEDAKMTGQKLSKFEKDLFDRYINPVCDEYNHQNPDMRIKVDDHGMTAEFSPEIARNKGDALIDFVFPFVDGKPDLTSPMYKNILIMGDSGTDENMMRKADELSNSHGLYIVSVTVQQQSTPEWMMEREYPHIVLGYNPESDPDMKLGGVLFVKRVYEVLLNSPD
ncbi:MAG: hypothetical protein V1870_01495 [Candidatus Aenigmatarchaeota archaeon]